MPLITGAVSSPRMSLRPVEKTGRVMRRPQHKFRVDHKPWELQAICLAPVLPGETLKNALLQARVVSDPLVAPLVGWWIEYYFFYVKHRQLASSADFVDMMLDPTATLAAGAASAPDYYNGKGFNWLNEITDVVVREWFREEGESATAPVVRTGRPAVRINVDGLHESLRDTTTFPAGGNPSGITTMEALEQAQHAYEYLRNMNLTQMTYEDFLRTYGVSVPAADDREKPELLRYVREWSYPTNTVEPTTGVPSSAMSWAIAQRMDKDRFFQEPGFIVGYSVARPKVYLSRQDSAASAVLDRAFRWLPALLADDPSSSLAEFANNAGPYATSTNGYWVDVRDLFVHGDQFVNCLSSFYQANGVALPTAALETKYATEAMADALFSGSGKYVHQDGNVAIHVLGTQWDRT